jgi:uncharacterized membrane protein
MAQAQVITPLEALSTGRDLFFKHWKSVLKLFGVMFAIQFAFGFVVGMLGEDGAGIASLIQLVGNILNAYLGYGFLKAMFALYDGKTVEVQDLAQPAGDAVKYVIGTFLMSLAVGVGMILFIIPGIYILTKYFFVPTLLADTNMGIREAFDASSKMTEGRQMDLFLFMVLGFVGMIIGLIALIVGAVAVSWMVMFGMIVLHRSLLAKAK